MLLSTIWKSDFSLSCHTFRLWRGEIICTKWWMSLGFLKGQLKNLWVPSCRMHKFFRLYLAVVSWLSGFLFDTWAEFTLGLMGINSSSLCHWGLHIFFWGFGLSLPLPNRFPSWCFSSILFAREVICHSFFGLKHFTSLRNGPWSPLKYLCACSASIFVSMVCSFSNSV